LKTRCCFLGRLTLSLNAGFPIRAIIPAITSAAAKTANFIPDIVSHAITISRDTLTTPVII
jgi:hypothetical protein